MNNVRKGEIFVLFNKKSVRSTVRNVEMLNGFVSFQGVRLNVYSFAVDGILIDTGAQSLAAQFQPFFHEIDVDKVVITHHHEDHTGGAAYIEKTFGWPIFIQNQSVQIAQQKAKYPLYRKLFWGKRAPFHASPLQETFTSRNAIWDVIATPGHAADHVALYNQETKQLFTGDLYVSPKTKVVLREESIPTIITSIQHVLTYDFEEVFCAHAGYVKDGRAALQKKLDYLVELSEKVQLLQQEGLTINEMNQQLFHKRYPITKFSGGEWDSKHIITSIINQ